MRRCARRVEEHIAAQRIEGKLRLQRRSIKTDAVLQPPLGGSIQIMSVKLQE